MKTTFFTLFSLFLALGFCGCKKAIDPWAALIGEPADSQATQAAFQQALLAQTAGDLDVALQTYTDLMIAQPTNALVRFQRGYLFLDSFEDPYLAMGEFQAYLRLAPDSDKAQAAREGLRLATDQIARNLGPQPVATPETSAFEQMKLRVAELEKTLADQNVLLEKANLERDSAKSELSTLQRKFSSVQRQLDALLSGGASSPAPKLSIAEAAESGSSKPVAAEPTSDQRTYKVRRGDTLWKIAQLNYGDASRCTDIREANRGKIGPNDELIENTILVLPY